MRIMKKFQAPTSKLQRSSNAQIPKSGPPFRSLDFGISLELGAWNLELSFQRLHLDGINRRQVAHDGVPRIAAVGRAINLAARRAEIYTARVKRIHGHRVAQHVDVTIFLRQAVRE